MKDSQTPAASPIASHMNWIFEQLKNHGLVFVLLGAAVWYLQGQNMKLQEKVMDCQGSQIEALQQQNENLIEAINNNTNVLKTLNNGEQKTSKKAR